MKTLISAIAFALAAATGIAHAADAASAPSKQQNKMSTCSADFKATGKAGSERQAYMKECLSKDNPKATQQNKMKTCSADFKATGKPGAERQAYMKECLSK